MTQQNISSMLRKTLFTLILFITVIQSGRAQDSSSSIDAIRQKLVGIWEYQGARNSKNYDKGFQKGRPAMYKLYGSDHHFCNFNYAKPHSIISSKGTWRVKNDSTLIETVQSSGNVNLMKNNTVMTFRMMDGKYLYLKWFFRKNDQGQAVNTWMEELWRRVQRPEE